MSEGVTASNINKYILWIKRRACAANNFLRNFVVCKIITIASNRGNERLALITMIISASWHTRNLGCIRQIRLRHRETEWGRDRKTIWFWRWVHGRQSHLVAANQTKDLVDVWWTILIQCSQGEFYPAEIKKRKIKQTTFTPTTFTPTHKIRMYCGTLHQDTPDLNISM